MLLKIELTTENFRDTVLFCELLAVLLAIVFYRKYNTSFVKYFLPLLIYSVVNEFFAKWYTNHINNNNFVLFNIYKVIELSFYFLLYKHLVKSKKNKKVIVILYVLYLLSVLITSFFSSFLYDGFEIPKFIGCIFVVISIIIYFSEILNTEKVLEINHSFIFWLSIAVFFYYITSIPFKMISKYYNDYHQIPYFYSYNYATVLMYYLIISFGLVWSKKE